MKLPFDKFDTGVSSVWLTEVQVFEVAAALRYGDAREFEVYRAPLPDSDEYKHEVAKFEGCLKK